MIKKNILHYYVNLLRMHDGKPRVSEEKGTCIYALHNIIRTMKLARQYMICGEDLSNLDFGNIPLNGIHWSDNGVTPSVFNNSIINEWCLRSGHSSQVNRISFSNDGNYFLTSNVTDSFVIIWDVKTGLMKHRIEVGQGAVAAFSHSGSHLIAGDYEGNIKLCDVQTGRVLINLYKHLARIKDIAFSCDDRYCISGADDNTVVLWDLVNNERKAILEEQTTGIESVDISQDNTHIATCSEAGNVLIYSLDSDLYRVVLSFNACSPCHVKFTNNTDGIIWTYHDFYYFDVIKGKIMPILQSNNERTFHLLHAENRLVVDGITDTKIIDLETDSIIRLCDESPWAIEAVALSSKKGHCLTATGDKIIRLWDIRTGACIRSYNSYNDLIDMAAFSESGKYCICRCSNTSLNVFDVLQSKWLGSYTDFSSIYISGIAINKDGNLCGICGTDAQILWNINNNEITELCKEGASSIVFGTNKTIVIACQAHRTIILDYITQKEIISIPEADSWRRSISISANNDLFYVGRRDGSITIYKTSTGEVVDVIKNVKLFCGTPREIILSPDSQLCLIIVENDDIKHSKFDTIKFWSLEKRDYIDNIIEQEEDVVSAAFLNNRHCVLRTTLRDFIWDIETSSLIQVLDFPNLLTQHMRHIIKPPFFITENYGEAVIWKITHLNNKYGYKVFGSLFNIDSLFINRCSFNNCLATKKTIEALLQYGGKYEQGYYCHLLS